jgi:hypothetical protein
MALAAQIAFVLVAREHIQREVRHVVRAVVVRAENGRGAVVIENDVARGFYTWPLDRIASPLPPAFVLGDAFDVGISGPLRALAAIRVGDRRQVVEIQILRSGSKVMKPVELPRAMTVVPHEGVLYVNAGVLHFGIDDEFPGGVAITVADDDVAGGPLQTLAAGPTIDARKQLLVQILGHIGAVQLTVQRADAVGAGIRHEFAFDGWINAWKPLR